MCRCKWAIGDDYIKYHDKEHGRVKLTDKDLFERLTLELFSTGLSFGTVCKKKKDFNRFFYNYNLSKISKMNELDVETGLQNEKLIRHEKKILAVINNAEVTKSLIKKYGSLWDYFVVNIDYSRGYEEMVNNLYDTMKKDNFKFVGKSVVSSFISSIGLRKSHEDYCSFKPVDSGNIKVDTPFGYLDVFYEDFHIYKSTLHHKDFINIDNSDKEVFAQFIERKVQLFFDNQITDFNLLFRIDGTDFKQKVLTEVTNIEKGEVVTYKELAQKIHSKAHRAVGTALSKNECQLLIPCHRVVAANSIGGYNNDVGLKMRLLNFERDKNGN